MKPYFNGKGMLDITVNISKNGWGVTVDLDDFVRIQNEGFTNISQKNKYVEHGMRTVYLWKGSVYHIPLFKFICNLPENNRYKLIHINGDKYDFRKVNLKYQLVETIDEEEVIWDHPPGKCASVLPDER